MSDGLRTTTQWAAVTTHKGSTKVPPQNCVRPWYVSSIACHGHEFTAASVPPTIRAWVNGRDPQSPKWVRNPSTSNTKEDVKSNFSSYKTITEYNRLVIFFLFICLFFTSECTVKKNYITCADKDLWPFFTTFLVLKSVLVESFTIY